ncbi:MAG: adenylate/guanylate cyclase domain-containing protein [Spirochaetales bacterium]|nr:adenylate/guanylate cyclase domain-containing protein [Spirochaetales bacterium]
MLRSILQRASRPGDLAADTRDKQLFVPMALVAISLGLLIAVVEYAFGLRAVAWMPLALALSFALNLALLVLSGSLALSHTLAFLALLILPALHQWSLGGFLATGGISLWGLGGPFGAIIFRSSREALAQFLLFLLVFALAILGERYYPSEYAGIPGHISLYLLIVNLSLFMSFVLLNVMHFRHQRDQAMAALDREHGLLRLEQGKSERLLLNILPERIALRLKNEPGYIAEAFSDVCVLFADIVNFTPLSARIAPERLVAILNEVFSRFDVLAEKHGLEKIKTIGDAYMAAAGLPDPVESPARRCAHMALAMRDLISDLHFEEAPDLNLRIGLASGPVVAGVIGSKKFIYDLWGDAVNTASRMESQGSAGQIQVTERVRDELDTEFLFADRGTIEVKGKGPLRTFFLKEPARLS